MGVPTRCYANQTPKRRKQTNFGAHISQKLKLTPVQCSGACQGGRSPKLKVNCAAQLDMTLHTAFPIVMFSVKRQEFLQRNPFQTPIKQKLTTMPSRTSKRTRRTTSVSSKKTNRKPIFARILPLSGTVTEKEFDEYIPLQGGREITPAERRKYSKILKEIKGH